MLFLLYIDKVRSYIPSDMQVSLYTDNVAAWVQHPIKEVTEEKVQQAVNKVADWSESRQMNLNSGKCESNFFSTDADEVHWSPNLSIKGIPIWHNPTPCFLEVKLDSTLSFGP